jgi:hypothetical protein
MNDDVVAYLVTALSILAFKLALIWAGVNVVRMGYELLVRGVSGEFKFKGEFSGSKADLVSASPGLLFALLGVLLLTAGAVIDKPFSIQWTNQDAAQQPAKPAKAPPSLPPEPPGRKE